MAKGISLRRIFALWTIALIAVFIAIRLIPLRPKSAGELVGTYLLENDLVKGEMNVYGNGTFAQQLLIKDTRVLAKSQGTWTYNPADGYVSFDEFLNPLSGSDSLNPYYDHPIGKGMGAVYWLGKLRIGGSVDDIPDWIKVR